MKLSTHALTMMALLYVVVCDRTPSDPAANDLPDWLAELILEIEGAPVADPAAAIYSYKYHGRVVFYLSSRCGDIQSQLYNANGIVLCFPDGGLDGGGDGRCDDFIAERENETLIWMDPRQR